MTCVALPGVAGASPRPCDAPLYPDACRFPFPICLSQATPTTRCGAGEVAVHLLFNHEARRGLAAETQEQLCVPCQQATSMRLA